MNTITVEVEDTADALTYLPDTVRKVLTDKYLEIRAAADKYTPGLQPDHLLALKQVASKIIAAALILRAQLPKIRAGHKIASQDRVDYAHQLITQALAVDLTSSQYQPIDPTTDAEGQSGLNRNGEPYTALITTPNGISALQWSNELELNGVLIRTSIPMHWHAIQRTFYQHNAHGFGHTREQAIEDARTRFADIDNSAFEYSDKLWPAETLLAMAHSKTERHKLRTIAFARGIPSDSPQLTAIADSIIKDQRLQELLGRAYTTTPPQALRHPPHPEPLTL